MKDKDILNYVGVFASTLLVAASAVYIYSPVIGSHAGELTAKVSAVVNPVASLTLDTDNLEFNVSPTIEGSFNSGSITASVNTNSLGGYELYFSSEDNETNMVHDNESVTDVITSDFEGTVTSATMGANKWGYSLDNVDFLKIPALSNQATLRDIDHMPDSSEKNNTVYIGTKISTGLSSGNYSKKVVFSVLAHETPEPPVPSMQTFDPTTLSEGESVQLRDARDDNLYTVKKLADGNVWMTENLRIANATITSEDSNLREGDSFTIPENDISLFGSYELAVYIDETAGGYYSFYAASAGLESNGDTNHVHSGDSPKDICPKGWRLPTGGSGGEFEVLYSKYGSTELMQGEPGFIRAGAVVNGEVRWPDVGHYWSSSSYASHSYDAFDANELVIHNNSVNATYYEKKSRGLNVRCIAKTGYSSMQSFNKTSIANVGDSVKLQDDRDGNVYTVKKLADGNIWMTENLRIFNKTISSADSDMQGDTTFTIPNSDITAFSTGTDSSATFINPLYVGFYNYYTASAGTGGSDNTTGNITSSICPKGWRLPSGENGGDYQTLYSHYDSAESLLGVPNFVYTGSVSNGTGEFRGGTGYYWTSNVYSSKQAYYFYVDDQGEFKTGEEDLGNGASAVIVQPKTKGLAIRCVAR